MFDILIYFRAIAPRSNMTINAMNNQVQRMNSNQGNQQVRQNQPQLIVLDEENQKTPNMSNTTRLTHFPSNLAATLAANPSLQIQPATNNNFSSKHKNIFNLRGFSFVYFFEYCIKKCFTLILRSLYIHILVLVIFSGIFNGSGSILFFICQKLFIE